MITTCETGAPLSCTYLSKPFLGCEDELAQKVSSIFTGVSNEDYFMQVLQKCNAHDVHFLNSNPSLFLCKPDSTSCVTDPCSLSILQKAIREGMNDCASQVIKRQWGFSYKDPEGNIPLHYAAAMGNTEILIELMKNDRMLTQRINVKNAAGHTPLHLAAEQGHAAIVSKLLERGANPNDKAPYQARGTKLAYATPLHLAVIRGHQETFDAYLAAKDWKNHLAGYKAPNLDLKIPEIGNLVHLAVYFNQYAMLEHLLNSHWDLFASQTTALNDKGETPLMLAARLGNVRAIQLFQRKNVNLEQSNPSGQRAFHFAAKAKQGTAMDLLNYYGVDISVQDEYGFEPKEYLMAALKEESKDESIDSHPLLMLFKDFKARRRDISEVPMAVNWLSHPPENLVFKGGGPKGIAYMGALNVLEENGFFNELKRVGGTSAGAIQASLISVGYKSEEMIGVFNSIDPREFMDHPVLHLLNRRSMSEISSDIYSQVGTKEIILGLEKVYDLSKRTAELYEIYLESPTDAALGLAKDAYNALSSAVKALWNTPGIADGNVFREWIDEKIAMKTAQALGKTKEDCRYLTFGELRKELVEKGVPGFRHLYVNTINTSTGMPVTINSEDAEWDRVIISDAIRASMSIPGIFKSHTLHVMPEKQFKLGTFDAKIRKDMRTEEKSFGHFVDGGMTANYPIDIFDYKKYHSTSNLGPGSDRIQNLRTLGLSNHDASAPVSENKPLKTIGDLVMAVGNIYANAEEYHLSKDPLNARRTILIDNLGVDFYDFGTDPIPLLRSGEKAALQAIGSFTGEVDEESRFALESSGIKFPHKYPAKMRQFADNIEALHNKLLKNPDTRKAVLWSEGDEKLELAISFRNRYGEQFSRILWITPENELTAYRALADSLQLKFQDSDTLEALRDGVHAALEVRREKKHYLFIYEGFGAMPTLPQGENGRFILLANEEPTGPTALDALQAPFFTPQEREYFSDHYFREIFDSIRNPNCEDKESCWDLDERQLEEYPWEKEAIDALNSNRWFTPAFKESQEYLRLRADDPRPASLFFSTPHTTKGVPLSPDAYLEDLGAHKGLLSLNKETDLKCKSVRSYKDICTEIHGASKLKEKIANLYIQANKNLLLRDAARHSYFVPDRNKPFSECYANSYISEKAKPIWED